MIIGIAITIFFIIMPTIVSNPICTEKNNCFHEITKSIRSGEKKFGVVTINFTDSNGIPNENFSGLLTNVNATFSGETQFIILRYLFPRKLVLLETDEDLKVEIDFFLGYIYYHRNASIVLGFAKGIEWNEV